MKMSKKSDRLIDAYTLMSSAFKIALESAFETFQEKHNLSKEITNFRGYTEIEIVKSKSEEGTPQGEQLFQAQVGAVIAALESATELMQNPKSVHPRIMGSFIASLSEVIMIGREVIDGHSSSEIKEVISSLKEMMNEIEVTEKKEDNESDQRNPL